MGDKNFSRVGGNDSGRKFGEAPVLGKVPRTPGSGVSATSEKHVRSRNKKKLTRFSLAWTFLLGFVAFSIIAVVTVSYYRNIVIGSTGNTDVHLLQKTNLDLAFQEKDPPKQPELKSEEALKIVRSALTNRDSTLIRDYFTLGTLNDPAKAIATLERIRKLEGEATQTDWLGHKHCDGRWIAEVVVSMSDNGRKLNRLAQITSGSDGKWRIDLDSYLRMTTPDWDKIISGESEISLVRIFIADDTYYNGIYSDESAWKAYALASPDVENILYAYARRGSAQESAINRILASEEAIHRATLAIRKNPAGSSRQFEITRVIAENWIIGDRDFDEAF